MPNTLQESMEDVSFAYMQALCAYNGYTLSKVERDNDGVDATIRCKGYPCNSSDCRKRSPSIDIQLKASYVKFKEKRNGEMRCVSHYTERPNKKGALSSQTAHPVQTQNKTRQNSLY